MATHLSPESATNARGPQAGVPVLASVHRSGYRARLQRRKYRRRIEKALRLVRRRLLLQTECAALVVGTTTDWWAFEHRQRVPERDELQIRWPEFKGRTGLLLVGRDWSSAAPHDIPARYHEAAVAAYTLWDNTGPPTSPGRDPGDPLVFTWMSNHERYYQRATRKLSWWSRREFAMNDWFARRQRQIPALNAVYSRLTWFVAGFFSALVVGLIIGFVGWRFFHR